MDLGKGLIGFIGVAFIAAVVAYSVSAPRNFENAMNEEVASLDGQSINGALREAKSEARREQCEAYSQAASAAWDRAVENDTLDRDSARIEEIDRQVDRFCN